MNYEHIQESARDAKQMEESSILGGDPLMETCTCTRVETEFSQMCDYCQALEKKHPGYFAGLEPSWTGTNSREGDGHDSDCATHNAPAYPNGSCDCSFINIEPDAWASKIMCIGPDYGKIKYDKLPIQSLNTLYYQHEKLYSEKAVRELITADRYKIINLEDQVKQLSSMIRQYEYAAGIKKEENERLNNLFRSTVSALARIDVALGVEDDVCNELEITLQAIEKLKADAKRGQQLALAVMNDNMGRG